MRKTIGAVLLTLGLLAATAAPAGAVVYLPPYWGSPVLHQNQQCISYDWQHPCARWIRLNGDFRQGTWANWVGERALANLCTGFVQDPGTGKWTAQFLHDPQGAQPDSIFNGFCTFNDWATRGADVVLPP